MEHVYHTHTETFSQTEAWIDALEVVEANRTALEALFRKDFSQVLLIGCGSTYYLALSAAVLFQDITARFARAIPAGELWMNPNFATLNGNLRHKTLLIAISRSGSTTETVRAVEAFKALNGGAVLTLTNYPGQPLVQMADLALVIEKGKEQSVAQTRSFASIYVATTALALIAGNHQAQLSELRRLPELGKRLLMEYESLAQDWGENLGLDRFYFLGSGLRYGLACEASLKMKEMSLTHTEPFHFLEFRHGPKSMVTDTTAIVGLLSDSNRALEQRVLDEAEGLGAKVLGLAERDASISFDSGLPETLRGVLYLPVLQAMAYYRSLAKGLNPDQPRNLTAVVTLD
ncbi:MAG: SIS domain-containing protein [Anaerolineales bacterium]|nr:SIS domain-containing protein [Anaerolineales bacterium]MDW8161540.1 SIS domain-containing protein [Anaerolineales bacterium]